MQRLETRWLVVHSPQRTVIVAHHWNDDFFCTCGKRSPCLHIRRVQNALNKKPQPLQLVKKRTKGPTFSNIPEQLSMPDYFDGFIPTRKFR
jgi:hypothetical protein